MPLTGRPILSLITQTEIARSRLEDFTGDQNLSCKSGTAHGASSTSHLIGASEVVMLFQYDQASSMLKSERK